MCDRRDKELTLDEKTKKDVKADTNNVKSNGDKKVFNDLNGLINNIKKTKLQKKVPLKK